MLRDSFENGSLVVVLFLGEEITAMNCMYKDVLAQAASAAIYDGSSTSGVDLPRTGCSHALVVPVPRAVMEEGSCILTTRE